MGKKLEPVDLIRLQAEMDKVNGIRSICEERG